MVIVGSQLYTLFLKIKGLNAQGVLMDEISFQDCLKLV